VTESNQRVQRFFPRMESTAGRDFESPAHGRIVGESAVWKEVLAQAMQVAATLTTVLLQGDSGTGKEVVARFIHRASPRKNGPFVAINCGALPETLVESELFGYERGAFTGAYQTKPGRIELASPGVLFLDEVSEMSRAAQAKFLRVLEEREFLRLGGTRLVKTNARVIAATNCDLHAAFKSGAFREDLYYRLRVFDIRIPPLRERPGDIALLTDAFLEEMGRTSGCPPARVTEGVRRLLMAHDWPGNVRELRNVLERATILSGGGLITPAHLSLQSAPALSSSTANLDEIAHHQIEQTLRETGWNVSKSARRLGLTRTQLYVRLRKYRLERPSHHAVN
jgi:transcriptional regulator with GAF, ATPase, and Fis domain